MIGSREGDPADLCACTASWYVGFTANQAVNDWRAPERAIPAPRSVRHGPFTELRLATSPAAVLLGRVGRRRTGSPGQSLRQLFRDRRNLAIYRVEAPGVRVKDGRADGRFAGGLLELRRTGELAQLRLSRDGAVGGGWRTVEACFEGSVAAVEVPDDSIQRSLVVERALVGSARRLEALESGGLLRMVYVGPARLRLRELLSIRDIHGRGAGGRAIAFLLRELVRDAFSLRGRVSVGDWVKFLGALVSAVSGLYWLLSELFSR